MYCQYIQNSNLEGLQILKFNIFIDPYSVRFSMIPGLLPWVLA